MNPVRELIFNVFRNYDVYEGDDFINLVLSFMINNKDKFTKEELEKALDEGLKK